jgi:hypothetical protein
MSYKVRVTTKFAHNVGSHTIDQNIYSFLNSLEEMNERRYDEWLATDDLYPMWSGYPYKVSGLKFDKATGQIISIELLEG